MPGTLTQLERTPRDVARWQKAQQQLLAGRYGLALTAYRDLAKRYPAVPELWFELGNAACGELDFPLANQAYSRVLELAPNNADMLVMIGRQYQALRQLDDARAAFERAVTVDPASVDARISLAVWFEKERRLDNAWDCVEACLAKHPRDDQARYFRAFLLQRKGRNAEAETALRDLIKDGPKYPYVKYASRHLLGVVLDQLGQYPEAMRWLRESKTIVRQLTDIKRLELAYDGRDQKGRELLAGLTPETLRRWREEGPASHSLWKPAFLGGHPRSGTTLIEQVLDAHPEVLAFDEPEAFRQEVSSRISMPDGARHAVEALDSLDRSLRARMRDRYFKSLLREVKVTSATKSLLDKNPSPTASLHIWLRVFPELKVIIALRDPRDVIISCFFLNIMLNATNANFLSLERATKHYADLMDVWLRLRDLGGFDWIETRYEDVVADLECQGRRVTEFLGLTWHPGQMRYYETARRKVLFAPTYHDVTRPVYKGAVGRWERYAQDLEPIQSRLAPYCRAFGYRE
jgi:tetratricopeptide (TPR) repeat protein